MRKFFQKIFSSKILIIVIITSILMFILIAYPHDWGIRRAIQSRIQIFVNVIKATADSSSVSSEKDFTSILFLHHSTGQNLIDQGGIREAFLREGFDFWDHGYNHQGLVRPDGSRAGYGYNIPDDNTDPDGLAQIFLQRLYRWPLNALSGLMQHDVIILKSCFPVSNITSNDQLDLYKTYFLEMRKVMAEHKDHIFILFTPPPLNPVATDVNAASRARTFANWLNSEEFLAGYPNIFEFDFFDLLAESGINAQDQNMLRASYRDGDDSHPNSKANKDIGPVFTRFVIDTIEEYRAFLSLHNN